MGNSSSSDNALTINGASRQDEDVEKMDRVEGLTRLITAETRRKKDVQRDQYDFTKENMQILKHVFKKMDPTVMKTGAATTHGEVQLSFKFKAEQKLLLVKVIRCRDLCAKDLRGKSADPYVKMTLLPQLDKKPSVHTTSVVKKSLNPTYHEIFMLHCDEELLIDGKLIVQVWDQDIMDRDDFLGETIVHFNSFQFSVNPVHTAWYSLGAETDLDISGELEISLMYEFPTTLQVTIHGAYNLANRYEDSQPQSFVKVQAPGLKSIYHTEVQRDTVNPVFEQTFEFPIAPEEFEQRYLIFHVIDHDDRASNESLGQCIIDLDNFDPEQGFRGKFELADLKNSSRLRSKWFQQATVQEFRESLNAHAAFRCPKFLFQRHDGSKVIRVTSRKAGSQAKLHLINGIPVH